MNNDDSDDSNGSFCRELKAKDVIKNLKVKNLYKKDTIAGHNVLLKIYDVTGK